MIGTRRILLSSFACVLGVSAVLMTSSQAGPKSAVSAKKKIVFVAGKPSHARGEHEHRAGCMLLAGQLNQSSLPVEAVVTTDGWPADKAVFDGAAAVVIYS